VDPTNFSTMKIIEICDILEIVSSKYILTRVIFGVSATCACASIQHANQLQLVQLHYINLKYINIKTESTAVGIRRADYATPLYPQKLALTTPTSGGRSIGIVLSRTKATEFFY
jgi:hypothetical protein